MRTRTRRCAGGMALAVGMAFSAAAWGEQAAPELPVAEWSAGYLSLEDFKGQVTAVVFFDDASS